MQCATIGLVEAIGAPSVIQLHPAVVRPQNGRHQPSSVDSVEGFEPVEAADVTAVAEVFAVLPITALSSYGRARRLYGPGLGLRQWLETASFDGWSLRWSAERPRKGIPRQTIREFLRKNPKGRFLVKTVYGLIAVVNGKATYEFEGAYLVGYWERVAC